MQPQYALQVMSTGETIIEQTSDRTMVGWQKLTERRILRWKNRAQRFKDAIHANDTIVAWTNYDDMQRALSANEFASVQKRVFRGYDLFFEKRSNAADTGASGADSAQTEHV